MSIQGVGKVLPCSGVFLFYKFKFQFKCQNDKHETFQKYFKWLYCFLGCFTLNLSPLLKNFLFYAHVRVSQDESNIKEDPTVASGHISLTQWAFAAEEAAVSGA